jgi:hypothetical protein
VLTRLLAKRPDRQLQTAPQTTRVNGFLKPPKATPKPPQSLLIANRLRPQSHSKAPPKLPQDYHKAPTRLLKGYPKASSNYLRLKGAQPGHRLNFIPYQLTDVCTGDGCRSTTVGYRYGAVAPLVLGAISPAPSLEFCPAASLSSDLLTRMLGASQPNATHNPRTFRWAPHLMQKDRTGYFAS